MSKKNKITILISIISLALVVMGVTYSYFKASTSGSETVSTVVGVSGKIEITYTDGTPQINASGIVPGWSASKTFTVENTGDGLAYYKLKIIDVTNTFTIEDSISYELTSTDGGANISKTSLPYTSTFITDGIEIGVGETHHYTVTTYYNDLDEDQSPDLGKSFTYTITIEGAKDNYPSYMTSAQEGTLLASIRDNNRVKTPLTTPGIHVSYTPSVISMSIGSSYNQYYWTYADGYEIDSSTGKFNLTGVHTGKYNAIYQNLAGKYIVGTSYSANSNSSNTAKTTTGLSTLIRVARADYYASSSSTLYYENIGSYVSVSSTFQAYYWTYGTGVEADMANSTSSSAKFKLTGVGTVKYNTDKDKLVGKYLVSNTPAGNSSSSNTAKTTNNLTSTYRVLAVGTNYITVELVIEGELSKSPDDYGTSLYYRGSIDNNYVKFANMCWRIVRITGDGSIKLALYNYNPNSVSNPCIKSEDGLERAFARYDNTTNGQAGKSTFHSTGTYNTYIGFMYGQYNGSTYETVHENTNNSVILTNLKAWYDAKFTSSQKELLADIIWCNDKSLASPTYNPYNWTDATINTGIGSVKTNYAALERLYRNEDPTLICPDASTSNSSYKKISKFTASDTNYGNGALNGYKIGLLTADEVTFAGTTYQDYSSSSYLYLNATTNWWLLSPANAYNSIANAFQVNTGMYLSQTTLGTVSGLRPSVALVPSVEVTGSGTQADPYVVVE